VAGGAVGWREAREWLSRRAGAVCEPLCGPTPIITTAMASFPSPRGREAWRACLIPGSSLVLAPLWSHVTARPRQSGTSLISQATPRWPAGGSRARPTGTSQRYETRLTAIPARSVASTYNEAALRGRAKTQIALRDRPRLAQFRGCRPATWAGPTSAMGLASCLSKAVDGTGGARDDDEFPGYGDDERPGRPGRIGEIVHGGGERGGLVCCFCFDQQLAVPVAVVAPRPADALPAVQRA
jgi:hypothetical protein